MNEQSTKAVNLCVHGWLDNAASFIPLSQYLTELPLIALDLAGHGLSAHRSADAHYHLIDWVYDLHLFIEALNLTTINLIGHSMGGMIACLYSATYPQSVSNLILLESAGAFTQDERFFVDNLRQAFVSRKETQKKYQTNKKRDVSVLQSLYKTRAMHSNLNIELARLIVDRNIRVCAQKFVWKSDKKLNTLSPIRLTESQAQAIFRSIVSPVLILLGDNGYPEIKKSAAERLQLFNRGKLQFINGGHHAHMQSAKQTAKLIRNFISR
ncbi:alpha/beta hydrolase [Catenovulum sediminis]|uniref:Alpha/beta hydrolase n=1 Tax=Catenovulum sediminis TaxID=1740262 RepID=A0ABV1RM07_9ALTE